MGYRRRSVGFHRWDRRTTRTPLTPSIAPSISVSTGLTPLPSTASVTRKKWSAAPSNRCRASPTSSPSARCAGKPSRSIYNSLKAESLAEEVEASLKRLQVDTIDLYQIHWPNPDSEIEEGWEALARLQEHGKIRWIGVSNFSVDQMKRAMTIAPITSLQPPYSMLRRAIETEILPFTLANGIGVINYSPMLSGMLTGKMATAPSARSESGPRRLAPQEQGIQ